MSDSLKEKTTQTLWNHLHSPIKLIHIIFILITAFNEPLYPLSQTVTFVFVTSYIFVQVFPLIGHLSMVKLAFDKSLLVLSNNVISRGK